MSNAKKVAFRLCATNELEILVNDAVAVALGPEWTEEQAVEAVKRLVGRCTSKSVDEIFKLDSLRTLRGWFKPGDTAYTILRHVSPSGMMRHISIRFVDKQGDMLSATWHVARLMGYKMACRGDDAIKVSGCGMDMGTDVVMNLSHVLFPDGADVTDHSGRTTHKGPSYVLRHAWL